MWVLLAFLSAFFAGITAILAKCGIKKTNSDVATFLRTCVVLVFAWVIALISGGINSMSEITVKNLCFLIVSGFFTGASWLCYFRALQTGPASVVVPIDKLSILVTIFFSYFVFGEKLTKKSGVGLVLLVAGTLLLLKK